MKFCDIHIRDPFIMADGGKYYLYGSRASETWGKCTGLDVYVSSDLENWSEPFEVFTRPEDFWSDRHFWAPEVHKYNDEYYMLVSFNSEDRHRGTQILKSTSPMGPFLVHSEGPVTPTEWGCLDGTLYIEDGVPYMVFCHEWEQVEDGEMCVIELTKDLKKAASEPKVLFRASEPKWSDGLAPGKYVTDGPFMYRTQNGRLIMIWSSFSNKNYCESLSYSDNGSILGNWIHDERLLFDNDGGHGMIFRTYNDDIMFIQHMPNNTPCERPHLFKIIEKDDSLYIKK
ncbi:MAG: family 43 glycosylhydrolase [Clostridia bacterium]|nr:family 43 glycosylhydrolase [Clostridia bacterium]